MNRLKNYGKNDVFDCFIQDNNTGTRIYFPVMPNGITESVSANFTQQDIVGASKPRIVYSSTSAKTMSFSLQNLTEDWVIFNYESLYDYVRAVQSLVYPEYIEGGIVQSPNLTLVLGNRAMSCVCTSVNVSWGNLVKEQQILSCNIDLSLLMTRNNVPGATWIRNYG